MLNQPFFFLSFIIIALLVFLIQLLFISSLSFFLLPSLFTPTCVLRLIEEARHMSSLSITPEKVLTFTAPTEDFLCPLTANTYGVEFYQFTIRDVEQNKVLFEVGQAPDSAPDEDVQETLARAAQLTPEEAAAMRTIRYQFAPSFLRKHAVGAKLVFGINGDKPVPKFRMIERHYFRNCLIKSFDFEFGFCIPHSTNTWEAIYDMPRLNPEWEEAIIANPYETVSDSFYFVDNKLIMHNKAFYAYNGPER